MALIPWTNKPVRAAHVPTARTRFGGPRSYSRASMPVDNLPTNDGSHMPLDTEVHWTINIAHVMPMLLLLLFLLIGVALS